MTYYPPGFKESLDRMAAIAERMERETAASQKENPLFADDISTEEGCIKFLRKAAKAGLLSGRMLPRKQKGPQTDD